MSAGLALLIWIALPSAWAAAETCPADDSTCAGEAASTSEAGWRSASAESLRVLDTSRCGIDRIRVEDLTEARFEANYRQQKPLVIVFPKGLASWAENPYNWSYTDLLEGYGSWEVAVGQSDLIVRRQGSGDSNVKMRDFLIEMLHKGSPSVEPKYMFDREFFNDWGSKLVNLPSYIKIDQFENNNIFFLGGSHSAVAFHHHPESWNFVAHGRKRWLMYPPCETPPGGFYPGVSFKEWLSGLYPSLDEKSLPTECVQNAGELMYVPDGWYHAVVNIGDTIAIGFQSSEPTTWLERQLMEVQLSQSLTPEDKVSIMQKVVKKFPKCAEAWYLLGNSHRLAGGRNAHVAHIQAVKLLPSFVLSRVELAKGLLEKAKGQEEAMSHFHHALSIAPSSFDARLELGNALTGLGRSREATAVLKPPWLQLDPATHLNPEGRYFHAIAAAKHALKRESVR